MERFRDSDKGDHGSDNDLKWYQKIFPNFIIGGKGGNKLN